jgi:hypothetical protein
MSRTSSSSSTAEWGSWLLMASVKASKKRPKKVALGTSAQEHQHFDRQCCVCTIARPQTQLQAARFHTQSMGGCMLQRGEVLQRRQVLQRSEVLQAALSVSRSSWLPSSTPFASRSCSASSAASAFFFRCMANTPVAKKLTTAIMAAIHADRSVWSCRYVHLHSPQPPHLLWLRKTGTLLQ